MSDVATRQLIAALREAFEGPADTPCYLDTNTGLIATAGSLTAAEASQTRGGNSIASHVAHILFGIEAFGAAVSGDRSRRDWSRSWNVSVVDDDEWRQLQDELRRGQESLREAIEAHASTSEESMANAITGVAHVVYHLGAIRQKLAFATG